MTKNYAIIENQIILFPQTDNERNITEENLECEFCKLSPTNCGNFKNSNVNACDFLRMKEEWKRVDL